VRRVRGRQHLEGGIWTTEKCVHDDVFGFFPLLGVSCSCWMWNADNGQFMQSFFGHHDSVTCGRFTPDGKGLVTGSLDGTVRMWNPRSGECTQKVRNKGKRGETR
jgi:WD40 repeat protein